MNRMGHEFVCTIVSDFHAVYIEWAIITLEYNFPVCESSFHSHLLSSHKPIEVRLFDTKYKLSILRLLT